MQISEIIKQFNMVEAKDDRWDGTGKRVWRSSVGRWGNQFATWHDIDQSLDGKLLNSDLSNYKPSTWYYVEGWNDGRYRTVHVCFGQMATFTYCEGDLSLSVCDTPDLFQEELESEAGCYGPPCDGSFLWADPLAATKLREINQANQGE